MNNQQQFEEEHRKLQFLARLPLLLNSSFDVKKVLSTALEHVKKELNAEAASIFLLHDSTEEVVFWALEGGDEQKLAGKRMSIKKGIVGWVIEKQQGVVSNDVKTDRRFFSEIDVDTNFVTRSLICVPLVVRGTKRLGTVQVLNRINNALFTETDLEFLEHFASQVALAIDNAYLYSQAKEKSQRLETLDRRKNDIISLIVHEFNTPLTIIRGSAELLTSGKHTEETQRKVNEMLSSVIDRLSKLIGQTRNIALVSRETFTANLQEVDVAQIFQDIEAQFAKPMQKRKLQLKTEVIAGTHAVLADHPLLLIVLQNLLSNAIRFTPDGGVITLSAKKGMGLIEFEVADTGIGIEESELEIIFEKFYETMENVHHSSGNFEFKSCGLGLGLPTALEIVKAHGSTIEVQSKPGEGSKFRFCLKPAS